MANKIQTREEGWSVCPPGTLRRMVSEVRSERRRAAGRLATSVLAGVMLLGASIWLGVQLSSVWRNNAPAAYSRMACAEVQQLLTQYGRGTLAAKLEARIAEHLDCCEHCRTAYQRIQRPQEGDQGQCGCDSPPIAAWQPRDGDQFAVWAAD